MSSLVIFSLSRGSSIIFIIGFILTSMIFLNKRKVIISLVLLFTLPILSVSIISNVESFENIKNAVERRIDKTISNNDPSSGRFTIWAEALELIEKKPFFGYMFEPFSIYYLGHDTPHQQYLEIFYKSGVIGLILYFSLTVISFFYLYKYKDYLGEFKDLCKMFLVGVVILSIRNMTQPNFTYSLTGNLMFFIFGLLISVIRSEIRKIIKMEKESKI
ncbi:O-antigen ligase family protein [Aliarcobacter cryaerophilus]|uniref:O-antigen ligase family protein n=1 Tax=Aliarcobacter cryaerophilus TaxID=28198 RepID=UPI0008322FBA|nr:O-antigen ligase family protein [Aliarcobacter cryaerophilus]